MTNEQREAIEDLKREYEQCNYTQSDLIIELDYAKEILSLIKEQQEEIEKLKVNLAKSCADRTLDRETLKNQENENLEALHRAYNEELQKKDMQIDLMAEIFYKRFKAELLLEYGFENEEQFKQYFAGLVEKE